LPDALKHRELHRLLFPLKKGKRLVLISCSKSKKNYRCPAKELYSESPTYQKKLRLAHLQDAEVYILSAKHGLVHPDQILEPYDKTLSDDNTSQQKAWARKVFQQMNAKKILNNVSEVVFYAGQTYSDRLAKLIATQKKVKVKRPLEGLGSGLQELYLNRMISLLDSKAS
jgi:hypothetical protein